MRLRAGASISEAGDLERGVTGVVQEDVDGACEEDEVLVRFRSRRYGNLVVRKDDLEALT